MIPYVLALTLLFAIFAHFIDGHIAYGYNNLWYSWMRIKMLFLMGNIYNKNTLFLTTED
jgi:hypothetical protein